MHESLDHLHRLLAGIERDRATAHGELREQMGTVGQASAQLKHETAALVTALRTPHVRGRWGEVQLRRVVEVAGLLEHCDFVEQPSAVNDEGAGVRPDLVVTLSDGRQVIVDAKVPFTGYIEAVQATDEAVREQRVQMHARQLRTHIDALAAAPLPDRLPPGRALHGPVRPVRRLPHHRAGGRARAAGVRLRPRRRASDAEHAAGAAAHRRLLVAAGAAGPRRRPGARGRPARLHARLSTLSGHLTRLGSALGTTMTRFNETVGSYERSVLTAARRFDDLGIAESPVPEPAAARGDGPHAAARRTPRPSGDMDDARDGTNG